MSGAEDGTGSPSNQARALADTAGTAQPSPTSASLASADPSPNSVNEAGIRKNRNRRLIRSRTPPPASPRTAAELQRKPRDLNGIRPAKKSDFGTSFLLKNSPLSGLATSDIENEDGVGEEQGAASSPEGSPVRTRPRSRASENNVADVGLTVTPATRPRPASSTGFYSNMANEQPLLVDNEFGFESIPLRRTLSLSALPPLMLAEPVEEDVVVIARSATPLVGALQPIDENSEVVVEIGTAAPLSLVNPNIGTSQPRESRDLDPRRLSISPPAPPDPFEVPALGSSGATTAHHRHSYSFSSNAPRILTTSSVPANTVAGFNSGNETTPTPTTAVITSQKVVCTQCLHPLAEDLYAAEQGEAGNMVHQPLLKHAAGEAHGRTPRLGNVWEFAGWGHVYHLDQLPDLPADSKESHSENLSLPALVSIAANDVMGSVFYTIGVTVLVSGAYAPIALLLVDIFVLLPYYFIFGELGTSVGLDGGVYSIKLISGGTKVASALAGAASLMCYVGTAVVGGASAVGYAGAEFGLENLSPWIMVGAEIGVLGLFAVLVLAGAKESAGLATGIFGFHTVTMLVLLGAGFYYLGASSGLVLVANWNQQASYLGDTSAASAIFRGFVVGSLGITGVESTLNYVSKAGNRFPSMMRWLVGMVGLVNPILALLALSVLPLGLFVTKTSSILSEMAQVAVGGGVWLRYWIVVDAVAVLGGTVLTAFVGVVGLLESVAADRILPAWMLQKNKFTGTRTWIVLFFLAFTAAVTLVLRGNVQDLSIIFAFAFLSVLAFLAEGCLAMKYRRSKLRRDFECATWVVLAGLAGVLAVIVGLAIDNVGIVGQFVAWVGGVWLIMVVCIKWVPILKMLVFLVDRLPFLERIFPDLSSKLIAKIRHIRMSKPILLFAKTDELHVLTKGATYVMKNEPSCGKLWICHFVDPKLGSTETETTAKQDGNNDDEELEDPETAIPNAATQQLVLRDGTGTANLEANVHTLDHAFPKCQMDLLLIRAPFTPQSVDKLSKAVGVEKNMMFMTCPGLSFPHGIGDFGGVRVIML